jgi:ribonuclease Z
MVNVITDEALNTGRDNLAQITVDIQNYHTSPEDAARVADEAGAQALVLSHIVPPLPRRVLYGAFLGDAHKFYDGPITVGEDGMVFNLPVDAPDTIERTRH